MVERDLEEDPKPYLLGAPPDYGFYKLDKGWRFGAACSVKHLRRLWLRKPDDRLPMEEPLRPKSSAV